MGDYHHSAHAVWDIKYHLVWITKYRYKVLRGEVAERALKPVRDLLDWSGLGAGRCRPTMSTCWWSCRRSWRRPSWCSS